MVHTYGLRYPRAGVALRPIPDRREKSAKRRKTKTLLAYLLWPPVRRGSFWNASGASWYGTPQAGSRQSTWWQWNYSSGEVLYAGQWRPLLRRQQQGAAVSRLQGIQSACERHWKRRPQSLDRLQRTLDSGRCL